MCIIDCVFFYHDVVPSATTQMTLLTGSYHMRSCVLVGDENRGEIVGGIPDHCLETEFLFYFWVNLFPTPQSRHGGGLRFWSGSCFFIFPSHRHYKAPHNFTTRCTFHYLTMSIIDCVFFHYDTVPSVITQMTLLRRAYHVRSCALVGDKNRRNWITHVSHW